MKSEKFQFIPKTMLVESLHLNHPVYELFNVEPNEIFNREFNHFQHYDKPVVAIFDGVPTVLSNKEFVLAAKDCGLKEMEVLLVDMDASEVPRFISFGAFHKVKSYKSKHHIVKFYSDHLKTNPKGIEWAKEMGPDHRKNLATILGVSEGTIENVVGFAKLSIDAAEQLDKREISLKQARIMSGIVKPTKKSAIKSPVPNLKKTQTEVNLESSADKGEENDNPHPGNSNKEDRLQSGPGDAFLNEFLKTIKKLQFQNIRIGGHNGEELLCYLDDADTTVYWKEKPIQSCKVIHEESKDKCTVKIVSVGNNEIIEITIKKGDILNALKIKPTNLSPAERKKDRLLMEGDCFN